MFSAAPILFFVGQSLAVNWGCPPPNWLPDGAEVPTCGYSARDLALGVSVGYDGSKVPNCTAFLGDPFTTVYLPHEYGEMDLRGCLLSVV